MKIAFFSNFLNHHQIPMSQAFYKMFGSDYTFIATEKVPDERIRLGYQNQFKEHPYLLESYLSEENYQKALDLGLQSDVVIIGSADEIFVKERFKANKLTYRYSERLFKTNKHVILYPYLILKRFTQDTLLRKKNVYMLSSSAFTPLDYSMFLSYPKKFFKWGYFPERITYNIDTLVENKWINETIEVLWVGRFIKWKRPFDALYTVEYLIRKGFNVHLTMIGTGLLESNLKDYVTKHDLNKHVSIIGAVDSKMVRQYMEKAVIYLMTSNKEEGWGAVVNEAMNSGCVVYAYYRVGSAPYLIKHGSNGKLYINRSHLMRQIENDLKHTNKLQSMSKQAYQTIFSVWNADIAAQRFVEVSSKLLNYETPLLPLDGPLSRAAIVTGYQVKLHIIHNRQYKLL